MSEYHAFVVELTGNVAHVQINRPEKINAMMSGAGTRLVNDRQGRPVMLFESEWALEYAQRQNPDVTFLTFHTD